MNNDNPAPESESASSSAGLTDATNSYSPGKPLTPWIIAIIALVALSDQLTKRWALEELSEIPGRTVSVIGDFLRWTLVYNEGGAMGTNLGSSTLYTVIGIGILIALVYYLWQYRFEGRIAIPLALIAGGAIGNLIDRFEHGKVVDWIDVNFFDISLLGFRLERWWTFNIADSAISVALVFMLWVSFRPGRQGSKARTEPTSASPNNETSEIQQKESS
jgi:signal peptidase II